MRAIVIKQFGGLDGLVIEKLPDPVPQRGFVLIEVKAFGINSAETHMRKGDWAEAALVSGIECVGLVESCPGGEFAVGTKVAAFMGGMGRTINVDKVAKGIYKAKPARVFQFDDIRQAHEAMESNQSNGKMVVRI